MAMRVLVANHQDLLCESLAARLDAAESLSVVATCASGAEAVRRAQALEPDIALLDCALPGPIGATEATLAIRGVVPRCHVVVLSDILEGPAVLRAFRAGARNYVMKSSSVESLVSGLLELGEGKTPLDPVVARLLVDEIARGEAEARLTPAEQQVLAMLSDGASNAEMAARLHMSMSTVKRHLSRVYEKLSAEGRHDAVERARARGLVVS
jgi:DNA-binding NarL/FixJ family response regulator